MARDSSAFGSRTQPLRRDARNFILSDRESVRPMITPDQTQTTLKLIDTMLSKHDDQDHKGSRGHLTAARCQIEAVIKLQAVEAK